MESRGKLRAVVHDGGAAAKSAERARVLDAAHTSYGQQRWTDAFSQLAAADQLAPLDVADLDRLAVAAHLIGRDDESTAAWTRAHEQSLAAGRLADAATAAFWVGFLAMLRGDMAQGSGWLARAQRLVEDAGVECVAQGLLLVPAGLVELDGGDPTAAFASFAKATAIGERCGSADVVAYGRLGRGQALIATGQIAEGVTCLDEAMVGVVAGEVGPITAGIVYCAVLLECRDIFDIRRAREWTAALTKWCESQPDLVPFRGQCLVHRSEVLTLRGEWPGALDEARRACERLAGHPAIGEAYYQEAEVHRLRGEHPEADAAYRAASEWGREPQPGLALLRLAQGNVDAAVASIRRVVDEAQSFNARASVLCACAEILLAANDVAAARLAADELGSLADGHPAPLLRANAAHADGEVRLAENDPRAALEPLRQALTLWRELGAPYQAARTRALIARACEQLGDLDSAGLERDAARKEFERLGAMPDVHRLGATPPAATSLPDGLTAREVEVLVLVATGQTNHEIARTLVVSDHTVRRHLQNIFAKIGVSSRAAATTYAFKHDLV